MAIAALTEEQQMIQDMARDFAREVLMPTAGQRDHTCEIPCRKPAPYG